MSDQQLTQRDQDRSRRYRLSALALLVGTGALGMTVTVASAQNCVYNLGTHVIELPSNRDEVDWTIQTNSLQPTVQANCPEEGELDFAHQLQLEFATDGRGLFAATVVLKQRMLVLSADAAELEDMNVTDVETTVLFNGGPSEISPPDAWWTYQRHFSGTQHVVRVNHDVNNIGQSAEIKVSLRRINSPATCRRSSPGQAQACTTAMWPCTATRPDSAQKRSQASRE